MRLSEQTNIVCVWLIWLGLVAPVGYGQTKLPADKPVFPVKPWSEAYATDCRIIRVLDGDTIEVEVRHTIRVRMLQCWAPESRTTNAAEKVRGLAAKNHLIDVIGDQEQARLLVPLATDLGDATTLGRVLGYVWLQGDDKSLSQHQVDGGFAVATDPKGRH